MRKVYEILRDGVFGETEITALRRTPCNVARTGVTTAPAWMVDSIRAEGIREPLVVRRTDAGGVVLRGNMRLLAARDSGLSTVPTITIVCDDDEAKRIIADHGHEPVGVIGVANEVAQLVAIGYNWQSAMREMGGLVDALFPEGAKTLAKRATLKGEEARKALATRDNGRMQTLKGYSVPMVQKAIADGNPLTVAAIRKIGAAWYADADFFAKEGKKVPENGGPVTAKARAEIAEAESKAETKKKEKADMEARLVEACENAPPSYRWTATADEAHAVLMALREQDDGTDCCAGAVVAVLSWIVDGGPRPQVEVAE